MIIQLRGTSGSGKSTVVRKIMDRYGVRQPEFEDGRRQPIAYACGLVRANTAALLYVPGHYETACGGTDTINGFDKIYDLIRAGHERGHDVLYEGLLASAEVLRAQALHEDGLPFLCICLTTPIDECQRRIVERRRTKAQSAGREPRPFGPNFRKNLESKHRGTIKSAERLRAAGARVLELSDEEAVKAIARELRLP